MTRYRIELERDESGAWLAWCREIPRCHTYGRSLQQARNRIHEALALWVDDAADAELEFSIRLPGAWRDAVRAYQRARARVAVAEREAQRVAGLLAHELTHQERLSLRDTAELMGLSHQRVQQLVAGFERPDAAPGVTRGSTGSSEASTAVAPWVDLARRPSSPWRICTRGDGCD